MRIRKAFVEISDVLVIEGYKKHIEPVEKKWPELQYIRLYRIKGNLYLREGFARLDELKAQGSTKCLAEIREATHTGLQRASDRARHKQHPRFLHSLPTKQYTALRAVETRKNAAMVAEAIAAAEPLRIHNRTLKTREELREAATQVVSDPEYRIFNQAVLQKLSGLSPAYIQSAISLRGSTPRFTINLSGKTTLSAEATKQVVAAYNKDPKTPYEDLAKQLDLPLISVMWAIIQHSRRTGRKVAVRKPEAMDDAIRAMRDPNNRGLAVTVISKKTGVSEHFLMKARRELGLTPKTTVIGKSGALHRSTRAHRNAVGERIRKALQDPRHAGQTIVQLAAEIGCSTMAVINNKRVLIGQGKIKQNKTA
jgi:hypothetical protein